MSLGRAGSTGSLTGDDVFTVETLQLSRFDPTPDEPEEEPDYSPTEILSWSTDKLISQLMVRVS